MRHSKLKWYIKQLLPLHYCTVSRPSVDGLEQGAQFIRWRMWFGRCFNVVRRPI